MPADAAAGPPPAGWRSADGSEPGPAAAGRTARCLDWQPRRSTGPDPNGHAHVLVARLVDPGTSEALSAWDKMLEMIISPPPEPSERSQR